VSLLGVQRLADIAATAADQPPLTHAQRMHLLAQLYAPHRQDLFSSAPHAGVATGGQAAPGGLGLSAKPGVRE